MINRRFVTDAAGLWVLGGSNRSAVVMYVGERSSDILGSDDCFLDMASANEVSEKRQPGLTKLDELSRLVAEDLQRALSLIAKSFDP